MFRTKNFLSIAHVIVIACITTIFVVNAVGQKQSEYISSADVKTSLFKEVNIVMNAANKAQANVLAPKNYGEAMKLYKEADDDLKKGKNLEDIQNKLAQSSAYFQKSINATKLAEVTFPNSMKARRDAQKTESAKFASKLWNEAEKKFNDAAGELEDGDINNAKKKATDAEEMYRKAELNAIKANYLDGTRELLKQAEQLDVKDRAPKTLKLAQDLVKKAEKELNENRYDTDVARSLAQQANYEAKHAIYLSKTIKQMKDKDQSWEDVILSSEKPLKKIAEKTDRVAMFNTGTDQTTHNIIDYISTSQNKVTELSQDLGQYHNESNLQKARIAEMEKQLGSQAKEKSSLAQQIANQAKTRELFTSVEQSFNKEEATVLREGNDIIIRLVGLSFPSASASIEPNYFGLLTKVRNAIDSFSECTVSILGNTDSYGGDVNNLQLSKERAEAVKQYILADGKLIDSNIEAIGYGESKPIASNETMSGRAANRRVDVVIHPWKPMSTLSSVSF